MPTDDPCPRCGAGRPPDAPEGLCPECLLRLAWTSDPSASPGDLEIAGGGADAKGHHLAASNGRRDQPVLEALAESIGAIQGVLLRDTEPIDGPGPVVRPTSDEMPDPPDRAGRFRLLGEIARGGMGAIFKGHDNDLGRDLAVKVLLERHGGDPDLLRRFVEEAQIAGQLQHPGIVPVYELGAFADRRPYFAMRLVKGRTLAEVLADRADPTLDRPRLLDIFRDVAQTMAYAHARGVIHRDLKPSNIMVGAFGEVQVMDWGLAKVLPRGGASDDARAGGIGSHETVITTARDGPEAGLSVAGSVMGTPSYMAPEQARGEEVDERADVFALGSILCEILTGRPAFTGRTPGEIQRKASRADLADALARLAAGVADAELVALARDALGPEPGDRPRDAGAIADRIEGHLAGVQEKLRIAERQRAVADATAVEERRRRRLQVALVASILGIVTLGGGGAFRYVQQRQALLGRVSVVLREAEVLRDQAIKDPAADPARWEASRAAARRADELLGEIDDTAARSRLAELLRQIDDGLRVALRDREMVERLAQIHGDFLVHSDRRLKDSSYAAAFREFGIDLDALAPDEAARRIAGRRVAPELAGAIDHWIFNRRNLVPPDLAGASRLSAVVRVADPDPWRNRLRDLLDRFVEDKAGVRDELRKLADSADPDRMPTASIQRLCSALTRQGEPERSLALLTAVYAAHPDDLQIVSDLGSAYTTMRPPRYADALPYALASVTLRPRSASARARLAHVLNELNRPEAALPHAREAVRLAPDSNSGRVSLGGALLRTGEREKAEVEFRAVRRTPENAMWVNDIGVAHDRVGSSSQASEFYREAIRLDPGNEVAHSNLGIRLLEQGEFDDARDAFRKAREVGRDNPALLPTIESGLARIERSIALRGRLPALLRGEDRPADLAERLAFAKVSYQVQWYAASARLFDEALRSNPSRGVLPSDRYNAACSAALAGCGRGRDHPGPDSEASARFRHQALDWLKAELDDWDKPLKSATGEFRRFVIQRVGHWKDDPDLAGIRDSAEVAKLPDSERDSFRALWAQVDDLLARAGGRKSTP